MAMAKSDEPAVSPAEEPESNLPDRPPENTAVARCVRAWHRAYNKKIAGGESAYKAECAGNKAFLRALPPLAGIGNIRDYIACVAQAAVMQVLHQKDAAQLLYAAQVAIGAVRREPNPPRSSAA